MRRPSKTIPSKYSRDEWRLLECLETDLVYLDNPPGYNSLASEFAWEKTSIKEKQDRQRREPVFAKISALSKQLRRWLALPSKRYTLAVALARTLFADRPTLRLLDIGCGAAGYTAAIAHRISTQLNKTVIPTGIEISDELARIAQETLKKQGGAVVHAPAVAGLAGMEPGQFEIIILHSMLEHEEDARGLLEGCRRVLADGGMLIIKVPNYASWNRIVRQHKWCGFRYPDHVNYFSPANIRLILELSGFCVHRMNFFDRIPTSDNLWVVAKNAPSLPDGESTAPDAR